MTDYAKESQSTGQPLTPTRPPRGIDPYTADELLLFAEYALDAYAAGGVARNEIVAEMLTVILRALADLVSRQPSDGNGLVQP